MHEVHTELRNIVAAASAAAEVASWHHFRYFTWTQYQCNNIGNVACYMAIYLHCTSHADQTGRYGT